MLVVRGWRLGLGEGAGPQAPISVDLSSEMGVLSNKMVA